MTVKKNKYNNNHNRDTTTTTANTTITSRWNKLYAITNSGQIHFKHVNMDTLSLLFSLWNLSLEYEGCVQ